MNCLDPKHLSLDELRHYGQLGFVKGVDPDVVKDIEFMAERAVEEAEVHPGLMRRWNTRLMEALETIFEYTPARLWWPKQYSLFKMLQEDAQVDD